MNNNFKQTGIGIIPVDWEVVRLGDVAELIMGQSPPGDTYNEIGKGMPFLQGKAEFGTISPKHVKYTTKPLKIAPKGSVLISVRAPVGDVNIADIEYCIGRGLSSLSLSKGENAFLFFLLNYFKNEIEKEGTGSTFKAINKSKLQEFEIPLPPLEEQQKIARVLSTIQQAIEQQDKITETTRKLKKSLMHKLFTEGLSGKEQKETEIGLIPESWNVVRLGDDDILTLTQYGLSIRGSTEGKYPILRMSNLTNGYVNPSDLQFVNVDKTTFRKFRLKRGDILFNRTNSIELVGKTSIFNLDGEFVFASYLIRLKANPDSLNPYFLNFYFNWDITQSRLKGLASRGVSQANISATRLKTLESPLPPFSEQQQIAHILSTVDKKIEIEDGRKATLKELFKTMLHKLMTGEIRLKDMEI